MLNCILVCWHRHLIFVVWYYPILLLHCQDADACFPILPFLFFLPRLCWRWCMRRAAKSWLCQSIPWLWGSWRTSLRPKWPWRAGRRRDYPCWMLSSHWRITSARWQTEETRYGYKIAFTAREPGCVCISKCILYIICYEACLCVYICLRSKGQYL